jgi:uncharacterized damage-inducible protein DinB
MKDEQETALRKRLVKHTKGGEAFRPIDDIIDQVTWKQAAQVPDRLPYSVYQQFAHLRLAQHDIIQFCLDPDYESPAWPDGYWPDQPGAENAQAWKSLQESYFSERATWCDYLLSAEDSLMDPIPHGDGQTLLREALLIIEHTAYHTGEIVAIMRQLDIYEG